MLNKTTYSIVGDLFTMNLHEILDGAINLPNVDCTFSYVWDYSNNIGLAHLVTIGSNEVNITLHPTFSRNSLIFKTTNCDKVIFIDNTLVCVENVKLNVNFNNEIENAYIEIN